MRPFATIEDVENLYRQLNEDEIYRAENLLETISNQLRYDAHKVGKDLDKLISEDPILESVAKSVTVDVLARCLMTPTEGAPMTQMSETAGPYTVSGTFLVPGGGLFIKKSELARLGIRRQRIGVIDLDTGN